ncbi:hypothetical protein PUNSTDRAFT_139405 [Punctularia strigosozonata HHB-11173 SS5]|uniref:Uncharacterized protein n=1 Tax=Punctularia strigosozonata (strain HHB-11173) TaxID=741275 RepID=R7S153_PUNST|nr:uncharacterized protein PUNSTDRAFT_139405 [Punctularia strigosozonata HHB-11173 SS5]EIN03522.1 hypothetical protein PUNSTDRAFT_139405 [Punctularia strigosozonata HHB-11173 SS5]
MSTSSHVSPDTHSPRYAVDAPVDDPTTFLEGSQREVEAMLEDPVGSEPAAETTGSGVMTMERWERMSDAERWIRAAVLTEYVSDRYMSALDRFEAGAVKILRDNSHKTAVAMADGLKAIVRGTNELTDIMVMAFEEDSTTHDASKNRSSGTSRPSDRRS